MLSAVVGKIVRAVATACALLAMAGCGDGDPQDATLRQEGGSEEAPPDEGEAATSEQPDGRQEPPATLSCMLESQGSASMFTANAESPGKYTSLEEAARGFIDGLFSFAPPVPATVEATLAPNTSGYALSEETLAFSDGTQFILAVAIEKMPAGGFGIGGWQVCSSAFESGLFEFRSEMTSEEGQIG